MNSLPLHKIYTTRSIIYVTPCMLGMTGSREQILNCHRFQTLPLPDELIYVLINGKYSCVKCLKPVTIQILLAVALFSFSFISLARSRDIIIYDFTLIWGTLCQNLLFYIRHSSRQKKHTKSLLSSYIDKTPLKYIYVFARRRNHDYVNCLSL